MKNGKSVWRKRLWLWLPALVLVILNLVFLSTYRFILAGQAHLRSIRVEKSEQDLLELEADRAALEDVMERALLNRDRVAEFYDRWVASESDRLTEVIAEVKDLARRAGVVSSSFRYPEEDLEDYDLLRRSIEFSVSGDYAQLRRFVNFVEVSDHFLMLEDVQLRDAGQGDATIRVNLKVSALFSRGPGLQPEETVIQDDLET